MHDDDVLGELAVQAEQQRHQAAGAGHLGEQVEERDRQRGDGRGQCGRASACTRKRQHVGHRVLAGVAQRLGDEQQRDEPRHQEADGVEQAVVAVEGDGADDAEEGRGRQVVARDGEAVLGARELGAAGVEGAGGFRLRSR